MSNKILLNIFLFLKKYKFLEYENFFISIPLLKIKQVNSTILTSTLCKEMTCQQLVGTCEKEFIANTFEEIATMRKKHGTEIFQKENDAHLKAMKEIQVLAKNPIVKCKNALLIRKNYLKVFLIYHYES